MKKKMIVILSLIVILFLALFFINQYKKNRALDGVDNPYASKQLEQSTIDQLDDPLYQNQINPEDLNQKLAQKEDITVYFYSPECSYCLETTPVLVPLAEEMGVDVKKVNVLEYKEAWDAYQLEGTPTLIHYEDGEEKGRIDGYQEASVFESFLEEYTLSKSDS